MTQDHLTKGEINLPEELHAILFALDLTEGVIPVMLFGAPFQACKSQSFQTAGSTEGNTVNFTAGLSRTTR